MYLFSISDVFSQGNLLIHPKRLNFDAKKDRVKTLNLTNTGKDSATYKISFVEIKMTPEGEIKKLDSILPGHRSASEYLRYFPKTIRLAPNESQLIKVQLLNAGQLAEGEYRSHLYLRAVPKVKPMEQQRNASRENGMGVRITPVFGYGITTIIRKGEPKLSVGLENLELESVGEDLRFLAMDMTRTGNVSSYGEIIVQHISENGKKSRIGLVKGVAVYADADLRRFKVQLKDLKNTDLTSGQLEVSYYSMGQPGRELYAQSTLEL
ncbi:hypothetical protein LPB144_07880 [Christiangramia salexigens]|uniref:Molecular chaperone n=1 Tax=Christiangramia salexigens TaxID=1913577 RepID=A0A1L3J8I3_9FLAO|nr:hypothetical protein LPB144_07880 [Christiangramia salexigens]